MNDLIKAMESYKKALISHQELLLNYSLIVKDIAKRISRLQIVIIILAINQMILFISLVVILSMIIR